MQMDILPPEALFDELVKAAEFKKQPQPLIEEIPPIGLRVEVAPPGENASFDLLDLYDNFKQAVPGGKLDLDYVDGFGFITKALEESTDTKGVPIGVDNDRSKILIVKVRPINSIITRRARELGMTGAKFQAAISPRFMASESLLESYRDFSFLPQITEKVNRIAQALSLSPELVSNKDLRARFSQIMWKNPSTLRQLILMGSKASFQTQLANFLHDENLEAANIQTAEQVPAEEEDPSALIGKFIAFNQLDRAQQELAAFEMRNFGRQFTRDERRAIAKKISADPSKAALVVLRQIEFFHAIENAKKRLRKLDVNEKQ